MTTYSVDDRLAENRKALTNYWNNLNLQNMGIFFGMIAFLIVIFGYLNQHMNVWQDIGWLTNILGDFYANVSSELASIVLTVLILDRLSERRADTRAKEERRQNLFRQAKSRSNDAAIEALDQILHDELWDALCDHYRNKEGRIDLSSVQWVGGVELEGVQLENAVLWAANLKNAVLWAANLEKAFLGEAHLENADLLAANLANANLGEAHLENANLRSANLENANLWVANLENANLEFAYLANVNLGEAQLANANLFRAHLENAFLAKAQLANANLFRAHLENANLFQANLENADLESIHLEDADLNNTNLRGAKNIEKASFNEKTVLPDAEMVNWDENKKPTFDKYWTPETDMTRYTNPDHSDFWEPKWVKQQRENDKK